MITRKIGDVCWYAYDAVIRSFVKIRVNPNILSFIGFAINLVAAYLFAYGYFRWAGVTIILGGVFDLTDGPTARRTRRVTPYGRVNRFMYVVVVALAMIGSVMTSYSRARAENLIPSCKVGFLERPERVVLIIIGALFNRMAPVLWVIVALSNLTVIHRVIHTYHEARRMEAEANSAPAPEELPKTSATPVAQS